MTPLRKERGVALVQDRLEHFGRPFEIPRAEKRIDRARIRAAVGKRHHQFFARKGHAFRLSLSHFQRIGKSEISVAFAVDVTVGRRGGTAAAEAFELPLDPFRARAYPRRDCPGSAPRRHAHDDARVRMHLYAHGPPPGTGPDLVTYRFSPMAFKVEEFAHLRIGHSDLVMREHNP